MRRFWGSLHKDVVLQFRGGSYYVEAFVAVFYAGPLSRLPPDWPLDLPLIVPAVLVINLMITTFYFVAALAILERDEGTLAAMAASPLRAGEYLAAKTVSLAFLAIGENLVVLVVFYGTGFEPVSLAVALVMLCTFYTMIGVITISRYDSINSFLIPSGVAISVLVTPPLLLHFGAVSGWLFYLHPLQPYLSLMTAAFRPLPRVELVYNVLAGASWLAQAYTLARRAYFRMALQ